MRLPIPRSRRHQQSLIRNTSFLMIAGIFTLLALPGIQKNMENAERVRNQAALNQTQQEMAELDAEVLKQNSDIADERLKTFCTDFIFSTNDPQRMAAIVEGLQVVDPVTGKPPGDGSIYCDVTGRTAVSRNGVLTDIKVSLNPSRYTLIQQALQSKGLTIEAGNPNSRPANVQEVGR